MLVGPRKYLKQIIKIELKRVKYPNWPEANQLATVYRHGRGFELGNTVNKSSYRTERGLNSGASELQVRRSNHSSTLPPSKAPQNTENISRTPD